MRTATVAAILALTVIFPVAVLTQSPETDTIGWIPELKLVSPITLPGSFVSSQVIYADAERIFAGSYQGDLFVMERDRSANFPVVQVLHFAAGVTAIHGDEDWLYVATRDGNMHQFSKTWPIQSTVSMLIARHGVSAVRASGNKVYVAKGQSAMTAAGDRLFISELNPGDGGLVVPDMRSFGDTFERNTTIVYDRASLEVVGRIPNPGFGLVNVAASRNFVFLTDYGWGIHVYDATNLNKVQFLERSTNTVAAARRRGMSFLVGGSEGGTVDLYALGSSRYELVGTAYLPELTGFQQPEDIEIRGLWFDGHDNLIFAGSSWGNNRTRRPELPSFFVLEIDRRLPPTE